jgi:hypothetical protein
VQFNAEDEKVCFLSALINALRQKVIVIREDLLQ